MERRAAARTGAILGFRRFPIRGKLAVMLAMPTLALVLIVTFNLLQVRRAAQDAGEQAELASAAAGVDSLLAMVQLERNLTGLHLVGSPVPEGLEVDNLKDARLRADEALEDFDTTIGLRSPQAQEAYRRALEAIAGEDGSRPGLDELRARVDDYSGELSFEADDPIEPEIFDGYGELIGLLSDGNAEVSQAVDDVDLHRGTEMIRVVGNQANTMAELVRELLMIRLRPEAGSLTAPDQVEQVVTLYGHFQANNQAIRNEATGPYRPLAEELFASPHMETFSGTVERALATGDVEIGDLLDSTIAEDLVDLSYRNFSVASSEELRRHADDLATEADRVQNLYIGLGFLILLLTSVVIWRMSRAIIGSLRALATHAAEMADRLPDAIQGIVDTPLGTDVQVPEVEPIHAGSRDEIGDVARTFDRVQGSALNMAVEQAVLRRNIADSLVSLGQRNHDLLNRQLDLITQLEKWETDHRSLANLFALDHLATRMRRNAESLLVLAGIAPPRRWATSVAIIDVIRASFGEVESYQRVVVPSVTPVTIAAPAAADLTHLLAELIENALAFSPPDRPVEVRGSGSPNDYILTVADSGVGLPADQLAQANRRLAGSESFTVAPSKYLGHYVAGQLAARHGIQVYLHSPTELPDRQAAAAAAAAARGESDGVTLVPGITAVIRLPAQMLSPPEAQGPDGSEVAPTHLLPPAPAQPQASPPVAAPPAPPAPPNGPASSGEGPRSSTGHDPS